MPKWTIEVEYLLPIFKTMVVEADSIKEAAARAVADADEHGWFDAKESRDSVSPHYVSAIVKGEHENVYAGMGTGADNEIVPPEFGQASAMQSWMSGDEADNG